MEHKTVIKDLLKSFDNEIIDLNVQLSSEASKQEYSRAAILKGQLDQAKRMRQMAESFRDNCDHEYKCTTDTDTWSSYHCTKCGHGKIIDFSKPKSTR